MNDIASMRNTGPREPAGFRSGVTGAATPTGLAAAETVGDFGVFFVEGKRRFYQVEGRGRRPDYRLQFAT